MPRVKRSVHARKKRRKVLGQAKGYWGLKKSSYKYAKEQVERVAHAVGESAPELVSSKG